MAGAGGGNYSRAVEHSGKHADPGGAPRDTRAEGEPAVRDAAEILARVAADEAAADEARERYRGELMISIDPDPRIAAVLGPGEKVVAIRHSAYLERRESRPEPDTPAGLAGELCVTSRRLVLLGRIRWSIDLEEIEEAGLSGERLLLVMRDGKGVWLEAAQPRLLRVEIATARAAVRA
jgi:hypothetical protein